jgi:hypothetical protein
VSFVDILVCIRLGVLQVITRSICVGQQHLSEQRGRSRSWGRWVLLCDVCGSLLGLGAAELHHQHDVQRWQHQQQRPGVRHPRCRHNHSRSKCRSRSRRGIRRRHGRQQRALRRRRAAAQADHAGVCGGRALLPRDRSLPLPVAGPWLPLQDPAGHHQARQRFHAAGLGATQCCVNRTLKCNAATIGDTRDR